MGRVVNNGNVAVYILMLIMLRCTVQGEQENSRRADIWPFSPGAAVTAVLSHLQAADGEFLNLLFWGSLLEIPCCQGGWAVSPRQRSASCMWLQGSSHLLSLQGTETYSGMWVIPAL